MPFEAGVAVAGDRPKSVVPGRTTSWAMMHERGIGLAQFTKALEHAGARVSASFASEALKALHANQLTGHENGLRFQ